MLSWLKKNRLSLLLVLTLVMALALAGCGKPAAQPEPPVEEPVEAVDEFALVAEVADAYLSAKKPPTMSPEDVYNAVVSEDPGVFILSIRSAEHYEKGHIPGAINIPYAEIWKEENLAKLPKDKKIVVICYTGHTASQATMLLNLLGYDAIAMKWGMMNWTSDPDVLNTKPFESAPEGYPIETEKNELTETYELPVLNTGFSDVAEIIKARAEAYLTAKKPPTIAPEDVYNAVVSEDPTMFILSVRTAEHYEAGHIPGAYNIPYATVANAENLAKLPKDKKIVVICYTGHTASQTTMLLNLLGYDAVAMKWGMMNWTSDPDVLNTKPFESAPEGYPIEVGM
jgi:rhodanese-related sulfurtransferase